MEIMILVTAVVLILCIVANKFSGKFGMPALIFFMFIGMLFGSDGIFKIQFNSFELAEKICSIALIFIMFYGGFNTKWKLAKCVAVKSITLSTAGVIITAGVTALFCKFVLNFSAVESFIIGAVLSSTDAASVFSILRQKKLNLKYSTASLLEVESGSNDPMSYMLTLVGISLMNPDKGGNIIVSILTQVVFGILIGIGLAVLCILILKKTKLITDGLDTVFIIAMVFLCFVFNDFVNGNQYLGVYLMGIILGNSKIKNKSTIIPFFDGITSIAQILIFFLLGLLTFPHEMPQIILPSLAIALCLTLLARPIAVFSLMLPFKCSVKQCALISFAGLRGAASCVFAIMVVANSGANNGKLFHIVFMVSLFSVATQGTLLPYISKKLGMVDNQTDVRKTFNDYTEESSMTLMRMLISENHNWVNRKIKDVSMPEKSLAIMIKRKEETIIPKGNTVICAGDNIILSVPGYESQGNEKLDEIHIDKNHSWCNKNIARLPLSKNELIAMVIRGEENIIPDGDTVICENDIVVTYNT